LRGKRMSRRKGFTLVELLVVIGIIALLISILLPALNNARKQANVTKCLSSLRQIGNAFNMYAVENQGYWPMAIHQYTIPSDPVPNRDKRWLHFISRYVTKNPDPNGDKDINFDGKNAAAHGQIKDANNVLWGCPSWDRVGWVSSAPTFNSDFHNGYSMNIYAFTPAPVTTVGGRTNWVYRILTGSVTQTTGWYFKASQWKRPSERALILDSVHVNTSVSPSWPWWTPATSPMPNVPNATIFSPDFNRHAKKPRGAKETESTISMLFCDGSARVVSAKEAWSAIRMVKAP
jgi:prepilin-type N-terminal cleavage/methylation domain-containing protein